jgi:RNA polymerase primary sigma factor
VSKTLQSPESMNTYLAEIHRTPLLTAGEEKELAALVLVGNAEARDKMVRSHLRLVVNIARGYAGRGLSMEDLVSEGSLGLLRAVEGFDPMMNTRFSTYATFWIKQSIKRGIVNTAKTIRIPNYLAQLIAEWRRTTNVLTDELGRSPTREEVAGHLGLSKKKLKAITGAIRVSNITKSDHDANMLGIIETLMDARAMSPAAAMGDADDVERVFHLIDNMDRREATILRLRFGFGGREPKTFREIGEFFGLTRERIRQIESEAIAKLGEGIRAG